MPAQFDVRKIEGKEYVTLKSVASFYEFRGAMKGDWFVMNSGRILAKFQIGSTAATLNACAAALFAGGARIISYVTFGRARLPGDAPS